MRSFRVEFFSPVSAAEPSAPILLLDFFAGRGRRRRNEIAAASRRCKNAIYITGGGFPAACEERYVFRRFPSRLVVLRSITGFHRVFLIKRSVTFGRKNENYPPWRS